MSADRAAAPSGVVTFLFTARIVEVADCQGEVIDTTDMRTALAVLAALFDRLGRFEPAATIFGFAVSSIIAAAVPEFSTAITHLREVLGDRTYESLAGEGEQMTTSAMVTYAYDQIDQVRAD